MTSTTKKFKAKGMHCVNCEKLIKKSLVGLEGIYNVRADYPAETVEIELDQSKVDLQKIYDALKEDGYELCPIEDEQTKQKEMDDSGAMEHKHAANEDAQKERDTEIITINKVTLWKTIAVILGVLLIISVFTNGFGIRGSSGASAINADARLAQPAQPQPNSQPSNAPSVDITSLMDDDDIKGSKDAPVTIIEWSDYECPFCVRFYSQTLGQIEREYIDTGKVKFVYRDFPLGFHKNAEKAAEAAECAGEQGKYYEMHNKLFEDGVSGGVDSFKQYAKDIGLDTGTFNDCLDSGKMESEVQKDSQDGQAAGISGTPGFVINGKLVVGAQPFEAFKQVIDAELAK